MGSKVSDDRIYTSHTLSSIPHRLRVRLVVRELRKLKIRGRFSYADVGCGGGSVTRKILAALKPAEATGFDRNAELLAEAGALDDGIKFKLWDLARQQPPARPFYLVTCLETLEHVEDYETALENLLRVTSGVLLITVPIERGIIGATKFLGKMLLGRGL